MKKVIFIMGGIAASSAFSSLLSSSFATPYLGKIVVSIQSYQSVETHGASVADLVVAGSMTELADFPTSTDCVDNKKHKKTHSNCK